MMELALIWVWLSQGLSYQVDQHSIDCGDGAADVVAARASIVLTRREICILSGVDAEVLEISSSLFGRIV